jgi:hypothetical protein
MPPFITVSGTVVDPMGIPYAGGTVVPILTVSATPLLPDGSSYVPPIGPFGLDKAGKFSFQLAANNQITPSGSTWSFIIASAIGTVPIAFGKQSVSFQVKNLTLNSSQDITTQINGVVQPLTFAASGGGGGGGTVTSVSAIAAPSTVITATVNNPTTTPSVNIELEDAPPNTVLGNNSASPAAPSYIPFPSGTIATVISKGSIGIGTAVIPANGNRVVSVTVPGKLVDDGVMWALGGSNTIAWDNTNSLVIIMGWADGAPTVISWAIRNPTSSPITPNQNNVIRYMVVR